MISYFTYLIDADDVRRTERVIRGSEIEFLVLTAPIGSRDTRHPNSKRFVGRVLRVTTVLQGCKGL